MNTDGDVGGEVEGGPLVMVKRNSTIAQITPCKNCGGSSFLTLTTYKRYWHICEACGDGYPVQRERYPFRFLPYADLEQQQELDEEKMYDYFTTDIHLELSEQEAKEFYERYLADKNLDWKGKSLLDISGGNGHFAKWYQRKFGMDVSLTEFNHRAIDYAKKNLNFEKVFKYDLNEDNLFELAGRKYDFIIAKACVMFCDDLNGFARQVREALNPGGVLILAHSIEPALGTLVRVQLDEYSYHTLRQPETVERAFRDAGFSVDWRTDEADLSLYVYDHDLLPHWKYLHYLYEFKALQEMKGKRIFNLPARDRRRSTFLLRS